MLFEMMKAKVSYWETGFEVLVMGDFCVHIGLGAEQSSRNGRKLLNLVGVCNLRVGNQLPQCNGRWTREMKERRLVVDYILLLRGLVMDKDSGELNLGSDHNLIWCEREEVDWRKERVIHNGNGRPTVGCNRKNTNR